MFQFTHDVIADVAEAQSLHIVTRVFEDAVSADLLARIVSFAFGFVGVGVANQAYHVESTHQVVEVAIVLHKRLFLARN